VLTPEVDPEDEPAPHPTRQPKATTAIATNVARARIARESTPGFGRWSTVDRLPAQG